MRKKDWKESFVRIFVITIILGLAGIPTYLFFILKSVLDPEGFWQKSVVYGFGIWWLGSFQLIFLVVAIGLIVYFLENF